MISCPAIIASGDCAGEECGATSKTVQKTGYCGRHQAPHFRVKDKPINKTKDRLEKKIKYEIKEDEVITSTDMMGVSHTRKITRYIPITAPFKLFSYEFYDGRIMTRSMTRKLVKANTICKIQYLGTHKKEPEPIIERAPLKILGQVKLAHAGSWARNAVGTNSDKDRINPIYGSAIKLYEHTTGKKRKENMCSVEGCVDEFKGGLIGAHVHLYGTQHNNNMYIIPMCRRHNNLYSPNANLTDDEIKLKNVQVFEDPSDNLVLSDEKLDSISPSSNYSDSSNSSDSIDSNSNSNVSSDSGSSLDSNQSPKAKSINRKKLWLLLRVDTIAVHITY